MCVCVCIQWHKNLVTCHQQTEREKNILLHTQQLGVILFKIKMFLLTSEATGVTVSIGHKLIGSGMIHAHFLKLMYIVHFGNVS